MLSLSRRRFISRLYEGRNPVVSGEWLLSAKLRELDEQYGRLHQRLARCQQADREQLEQALNRLWAEAESTDRQLLERTRGSRCPEAASLAQAQLEYNRQTEAILQGGGIPPAEKAALYAEYAIDYATQAARHAIIAALTALELQQE